MLSCCYSGAITADQERLVWKPPYTFKEQPRFKMRCATNTLFFFDSHILSNISAVRYHWNYSISLFTITHFFHSWHFQVFCSYKACADVYVNTDFMYTWNTCKNMYLANIIHSSFLHSFFILFFAFPISSVNLISVSHIWIYTLTS